MASSPLNFAFMFTFIRLGSIHLSHWYCKTMKHHITHGWVGLPPLKEVIVGFYFPIPKGQLCTNVSFTTLSTPQYNLISYGNAFAHCIIPTHFALFTPFTLLDA